MRTVHNLGAFLAAARARRDTYRYADREDPSVVPLFGPIDADTVVDVAAYLLAAWPLPITVLIDSQGGEVDAALDIAALLAEYAERTGHPVTTVTTRAQSGAGIVAQAGARRVIHPHGVVGMHLPYQIHGGFTATMFDLRAILDDGRASYDLRCSAGAYLLQLLRSARRVADVYAQRTGQPAAVWRAAMREEHTYGAYAAMSVGLADEIVGI